MDSKFGQAAPCSRHDGEGNAVPLKYAFCVLSNRVHGSGQWSITPFESLYHANNSFREHYRNATTPRATSVVVAVGDDGIVEVFKHCALDGDVLTVSGAVHLWGWHELEYDLYQTLWPEKAELELPIERITPPASHRQNRPAYDANSTPETAIHKQMQDVELSIDAFLTFGIELIRRQGYNATAALIGAYMEALCEVFNQWRIENNVGVCIMHNLDGLPGFIQEVVHADSGNRESY